MRENSGERKESGKGKWRNLSHSCLVCQVAWHSIGGIFGVRGKVNKQTSLDSRHHFSTIEANNSPQEGLFGDCTVSRRNYHQCSNHLYFTVIARNSFRTWRCLDCGPLSRLVHFSWSVRHLSKAATAHGTGIHKVQRAQEKIQEKNEELLVSVHLVSSTLILYSIFQFHRNYWSFLVPFRVLIFIST